MKTKTSSLPLRRGRTSRHERPIAAGSSVIDKPPFRQGFRQLFQQGDGLGLDLRRDALAGGFGVGLDLLRSGIGTLLGHGRIDVFAESMSSPMPIGNPVRRIGKPAAQGLEHGPPSPAARCRSCPRVRTSGGCTCHRRNYSTADRVHHLMRLFFGSILV